MYIIYIYIYTIYIIHIYTYTLDIASDANVHGACSSGGAQRRRRRRGGGGGTSLGQGGAGGIASVCGLLAVTDAPARTWDMGHGTPHETWGYDGDMIGICLGYDCDSNLGCYGISDNYCGILIVGVVPETHGKRKQHGLTLHFPDFEN